MLIGHLLGLSSGIDTGNKTMNRSCLQEAYNSREQMNDERSVASSWHRGGSPHSGGGHEGFRESKLEITQVVRLEGKEFQQRQEMQRKAEVLPVKSGWPGMYLSGHWGS